MGKTKTYIDSTYWKFKERDKADFKDKTNEEINNSIDEILVEREIDPHEQAYIQFEHKKNMEKIDDIYYGALERLNRVQSLVVEGIVKKHREIEEENQGLSEVERDKCWKISKGK